MFQSMSRQLGPIGPDHFDLETPTTQEDVIAALAAEGPTFLPPPEPPTLMTVTVYEKERVINTYRDVVGSGMIGPSTFRFETTEGVIVLLDTSGRDFILERQ